MFFHWNILSLGHHYFFGICLFRVDILAVANLVLEHFPYWLHEKHDTCMLDLFPPLLQSYQYVFAGVFLKPFLAVKCRSM